MLDALARSVGQGLVRREARRAEEAGRLNASSSSVPRFGDVMRDVLDHPSGSEDEEAETEVWSSGEEERERRYLARDAEFDGSFSEDEREFLEELDGDGGAWMGMVVLPRLVKGARKRMVGRGMRSGSMMMRWGSFRRRHQHHSSSSSNSRRRW